MPEDVLVHERAHLAQARTDLARMRAHTAALLDTQKMWGNDELTTRALTASLARRFEQLLDDGVTPLFFGRLDYEGTDEVFHIGRRHVSGVDGEPVVVDWRAPVAGPYYRATAQDRQGIARRRRFGFRNGVLTAYEDDRLLGGTAVSRLLLQEIERPRSGPMRDIVATVQPEQDLLVRAPLEQTVCVQGAPGTGKTAVGLHRAAYLLYAHRARLAGTGVLIVGPNRAFLAYVQEVLPALGEVQVTQSTVDDLSPSVRVRRLAGEAEERLKGDARCAVVLERALWAQAVRPSGPLVLAVGARRWRLWPEQVREIERSVRGRGLAWNAGRSALAGALAAALVRQQDDEGVSSGERAVERLARSKVVTAYVDELWPSQTPVRLVTAVLGDRALLATAAHGVLDDVEQEILATSPPGRWSRADLPLLDEAAHLLERVAGYAHVVVDEAQDLSAMALRVIGRRCVTGSATVLGDLAQGTTPGAPADWAQVLVHLGKPAGRLDVLTTGYRVPREVLDLANRLLPTIAPGLPPAGSLRSVPGSLELRPVQDLIAAAVTAVLDRTGAGSVAVVAVDLTSLQAVGAALAAAGVEAELLVDGAAAAQVALVPSALVKGLEFDSVVLLEPAAIAGSGAYGLRALYVALTRAVSSLVVLHTRDLPDELTRTVSGPIAPGDALAGDEQAPPA